MPIFNHNKVPDKLVTWNVYYTLHRIKQGVPRLTRSVAGLSLRRQAFNPSLVHVVFVVEKVVLGQILLSVLRFSSASIIAAILHIHPFVY